MRIYEELILREEYNDNNDGLWDDFEQMIMKKTITMMMTMIQNTWYMMMQDDHNIYGAAWPKPVRFETCEDYIISQDADQWGKSNFMNRAANKIIKDK